MDMEGMMNDDTGRESGLLWNEQRTTLGPATGYELVFAAHNAVRSRAQSEPCLQEMLDRREKNTTRCCYACFLFTRVSGVLHVSGVEP